jgi:uncharacterized protein
LDERLFYHYNAWKKGDFRLPPGTVERDIHDKAFKLLKEPEILSLLGLRQTGKSTLVFQLISDLLKKGGTPERIFYFTLDDLSLRQELSASHGQLLNILERFLGEDIGQLKNQIYLFIDEVQKLPGFVEYIKSLYDLHLPIKWTLTGSSSLTLKAQIKESLAGRVLSLPILPFSENEMFKGHGFPPPDKSGIRDLLLGKTKPDLKALKHYQSRLLPHKQKIIQLLDETMVFGGLPAVALSTDPEKRQILLRNYRDTYLDQDIRNLVKEDKLWVYQKVMELMASRVGDILNYSNIAAQLEVTVDTVKRYTMLLEKTFIITTLTTYSRNVRNEVLKTPKVYFTDLGLRNILLGLDSINQIERFNQYGITLENLMLTRLVTLLPLFSPEVRLHYWRTKAKEEVDLVIQSPERMIPIEVKSDKKIQARHLKGLRTFLQKEKENIGVLVGRFEETNIIEEGNTRIFLVPHWMV